MTDNIKMERIWQDIEFFELLVTCTNRNITVSTEVYMTDTSIDELHEQIGTILQLKDKTVLWTSGERGNQSTPCIEFNISMKDPGGHVLIEVFMELNDGGSLDKHHCCFYLNTELGMLYDFNEKLMKLKEKKIGTSISLIPE